MREGFNCKLIKGVDGTHLFWLEAHFSLIFPVYMIGIH